MAKHVRSKDRDKVDQPTLRPTRKLTTSVGGGLAGVHIVEWVGNGLLGLDIPQIVAADIVIVIAGVVAWWVKDRA